MDVDHLPQSRDEVQGLRRRLEREILAKAKELAEAQAQLDALAIVYPGEVARA